MASVTFHKVADWHKTVAFGHADEKILFSKKWPKEALEAMDKTGFSYADPWSKIYGLLAAMDEMVNGEEKTFTLKRDSKFWIQLKGKAIEANHDHFIELIAELAKHEQRFLKKGTYTFFCDIKSLLAVFEEATR